MLPIKQEEPPIYPLELTAEAAEEEENQRLIAKYISDVTKSMIKYEQTAGALMQQVQRTHGCLSLLMPPMAKIILKGLPRDYIHLPQTIPESRGVKSIFGKGITKRIKEINEEYIKLRQLTNLHAAGADHSQDRINKVVKIVELLQQLFVQGSVDVATIGRSLKNLPPETLDISQSQSSNLCP